MPFEFLSVPPRIHDEKNENDKTQDKQHQSAGFILP
jgi:hypothetical protein